MQDKSEASIRFKARMGGAFQLLEAITATYGQVIVLGKLIVSGDSAATAANILGHERLFWLGFASSIIGVVCHLAWALIFYELFKVVNRSLSLFAAFVVLVACGIQTLTILFYVAPLYVLKGGVPLSAFTPEQLQALAYIMLKLSGEAFDLYLVFFGLWCALIGYLIFKSTFLPRILGVLLAIAGAGWMMFLLPPVGSHLFPYIAAASALGEVPLEFWLLIGSVNARRWKEQALASGMLIPA
ncbi:MAG TPA: DUF4386 domain-containing protein [Steroidobacteraceae bacterium]|jgi:hypothetical protein|nr:DUF4386 domain-containing protein [Steroidobacteraceae bacterium]